MKKVQQISIDKLTTTYGVGSQVELQDKTAITIIPFDQWDIYRDVDHQKKIMEERLRERIKHLGFEKLDYFFEFPVIEDDVKAFNPDKSHLRMMISAEYFPKWFYCPKCHKLMPLTKWERHWKEERNSDTFKNNQPRCHVDCRNLKQIRFVLISMNTGDMIDLPWHLLFNSNDEIIHRENKEGYTVYTINCRDKNLLTYDDDLVKQGQYITFCSRNRTGSIEDLYVNVGDKIKNMSEIMKSYFIINGTCYKTTVRTSSNVYYPYCVNSIYIPKEPITASLIKKVREAYENFSEKEAKKIFNFLKSDYNKLTERDVQGIIDSNFQFTDHYNTEDDFRLDEYEYIVNKDNYEDGKCDKDEDCKIELYGKNLGIKFIKDIYCLHKLKVTSVQPAYSRVDKIPYSYMTLWRGVNPETPKRWYDVSKQKENTEVPVGLHKTCNDDIKNITCMPALQEYGEGFFIDLDLTSIKEKDRKIFLHTLCHAIMKELEFVCGYPLAGMHERLYFLENSDVKRYGFMIYAVGGTNGSYGGMVSLFSSHRIVYIIKNAIERAKDCPNDPICEQEKGHCFACLDLPETACEEFNQNLNRNTMNSYNADI